jgi:ketosteroid isomerase-like protein
MMGRLFDITQAVADAAERKDWDALASFYAENLTAWSPGYDVAGRSEMVEVIQAQNGPFEDIQQEVTLVAETEDTVVTEWVWSVPHPSNVGRVSLRGLSYFVFDRDDRMKTLRQYWDNAGLMQQFEAATGTT